MAGKGIFISYRGNDSQSTVDRLYDWLRIAFGKEYVFRDVAETGDDNWRETIDHYLQESKVCVVVIGPRWLDGHNAKALLEDGDRVRYEIKRAVQMAPYGPRTGTLTVIPVLVENTPAPKDKDLPEDLRDLFKFAFHWLTTKEWGADLRTLQAAISKAPDLKPADDFGTLLDQSERAEAYIRKQGKKNKFKNCQIEGLLGTVRTLVSKIAESDEPTGMKKALAALADKNFSAAEKEFEEILKKFIATAQSAAPEAGSAARHLGNLALLHDEKKAAEYYRQAIKFDPADLQNWCLLSAVKNSEEYKRPLEEFRVLEEEFKILHGALNDVPESQKPEDRIANLHQKIHGLPDDKPRTALCLSGGGIRSATFSLGIIQGLAKTGWLEKFHYLSTVSGGSYIGSWLSSWTARTKESESNPVVSQPAIEALKNPLFESQPIQRLRAYSNYLSPVWGFSIDFLTLISTYLRNLFLHWLVIVPLIAAVLIVPRLHLAVIHWSPKEGSPERFFSLWWFFAAGLIGAIVGIAYVVKDLPHRRCDQKSHSGGTNRQSQHPNSSNNRFVSLCFLPILFAAVFLSWGWVQLPTQAPNLDWYWYGIGGALLHLGGVIVGLVWRKRERKLPPPASKSLIVILASGAVGGFILYLARGWVETLKEFSCQQVYATFSVPFFLGCLWVATAVYAAFVRRISTEEEREWWARSGAWWLGASIVWILGFVVVLYGPPWLLCSEWMQTNFTDSAETVALGGSLLGILTGAIGYWTKNGPALQKRAKGIAAKLGLRLLDLGAMAFTIFLLMTISYLISIALVSFDAVQLAVKSELNGEFMWWGGEVYVLALKKVSSLLLFALLGGLFLFGMFMAWVEGVNTFSLHGMYKNRLIRAYLGATSQRRRPHWFSKFDPDDDIPMKKLMLSGNKLFHVINSTLNIAKPSEEHLERQQRKAASFTFSSLFSGGDAVGYLPTNFYTGGRGGLTLGTAMTISGAAACPNMGYHTSPMVAFVMTFFNLRLGWWLPNPGPAGVKGWNQDDRKMGFRALMAEAFGRTSIESPYVYLSDGGHFENLGLYEMVKRRCRYILMVDVGGDHLYECEDLQNAIRRIRIDFGISIEFKNLPNAECISKSAVSVGTIGYNEVDKNCNDGKIIYIKPMLCGDEPLDVKRYADASKNSAKPFPHQSTSDQFFDETQFESYRMLGQFIAGKIFPKNDPSAECNAWESLIKKLEPESNREDRNVVLPTPSDKEKKDTLSTEGKGGGILSAISESLKSMGPGAMLATTLTVGGAAGITGTLAVNGLPDSGTQVTMVTTAPDTRIVTAPGVNPDDLKRLSKGVPDLLKSLEELTRTVDLLGETLRTGISLPALESKLTKLEQIIQVWRQAGEVRANELSAQILEIKELLAGVQRTLPNDADAGLPLLQTINTTLKEIDEKLDKLNDINNSVKEIAPRRNVRGGIEGGLR